MHRVPPLVVRLYEIVDELERMFPGRSFTPDGHMVGSIGEAWAKSMFDLELLPSSFKTHDARAKDGRLVQIKATQGRSVSLYGEPAHLLVLKLLRTGHADVVYNGPGAPAWHRAGSVGKNGQRPIGVGTLIKLNATLTDDDRLKRVVEAMPPSSA